MIYIFASTLILTVVLILWYVRYFLLVNLLERYSRSGYNIYLFMTLAIFFVTLVSLSVTAGFTMSVLGLEAISVAMVNLIDYAALILIPIGAHTLVLQIRLDKKLKPVLHPNDHRRRFGVYIMTAMTVGFLILAWLLYVRLVEVAWFYG
ncbi:MAG: hypothetical protein EA374_00750 [Acholeplasmatales bacterium]|nr:MAG: hypothetical protein EA374_00750 [Acholeplasmatales bacterium]